MYKNRTITEKIHNNIIINIQYCVHAFMCVPCQYSTFQVRCSITLVRDGGLQIQGVVLSIGMVIQGTELRTPTCHVHLRHWSLETAAVTIRFEALLDVFYVGILGEKDQSDGLFEWPWKKRIKVRKEIRSWRHGAGRNTCIEGYLMDH